MSDLISRSETIDLLYQVFEKHSMATDKNSPLGGFGAELFKSIKEMPTTYDVDKVIEKLEKELSLADKEKERCTGKNHLQFDSAKGYASGISTATEIVKQGGVSDDVCEWKLEDEEANLYLTGCQQRQLIFDGTPEENGYRYCPYCGKKIKVVDR